MEPKPWCIGLFLSRPKHCTCLLLRYDYYLLVSMFVYRAFRKTLLASLCTVDHWTARPLCTVCGVEWGAVHSWMGLGSAGSRSISYCSLIYRHITHPPSRQLARGWLMTDDAALWTPLLLLLQVQLWRERQASHRTPLVRSLTLSRSLSYTTTLCKSCFTDKLHCHAVIAEFHPAWLVSKNRIFMDNALDWLIFYLDMQIFHWFGCRCQCLSSRQS